jgi:hypothetical protein
MGKTKIFTEHVDIHIDLSEWEDEELIEEVRARGYFVEEPPLDLVSVGTHWNRGAKKEALILLEREYPELHGISQLVN